MDPNLANLFYLLAAILFIMGLKGLTHPRTAVRGNQLGALGMLVAIVTVLLATTGVNFVWIIVGVILGGLVGVILAVKIEMTAMPQMVALFNGFGGGASFIVAGAALHETVHETVQTGGVIHNQLSISIAVSGLIGAVTLLGSLVAFGKMQ